MYDFWFPQYITTNNYSFFFFFSTTAPNRTNNYSWLEALLITKPSNILYVLYTIYLQ